MFRGEYLLEIVERPALWMGQPVVLQWCAEGEGAVLGTVWLCARRQELRQLSGSTVCPLLQASLGTGWHHLPGISPP